MQLKKKRYVTLIEMMIVMVLIAIITGVVAYNYRGSLDEGKVFKTKMGAERLENILNLAAAKEPEIFNHLDKWQDYVKASPLVQNAEALSKDGWGDTYQVTVEDGRIKVSSARLKDYESKHYTLQ